MIEKMKSLRVLCFSATIALLLMLAGCLPADSSIEWSDDHLFRHTRSPVISSPVAWDFNGNGSMEIAIGSWDGYFYLLDSDLKDLPGWPKYSPKGFFSSAALADLDGDGVLEIIVGSEIGKLYAWKFDGSDVPGFPIDLGYQIWASPMILPGPLIALGGLGYMHVFDALGRPVAGWPKPIIGWPDATAATDGNIIALTTLIPGDYSQGWIYAWTVSGRLLPGFPLELPLDSDSSPAIVELDDDSTTWIIFGDDAGYLHVINTKGESRPGFPVRSQGPPSGEPIPSPDSAGGNIYSIEASPAVADLSGDGRYEIVVGSWDGQLYVINDKGELLPGWPNRVGDQIISSAALIDLTGDNRLDIIVGSKDEYLYGWDFDGEQLPGFPVHLKAHIFSSPWIGDLGGNGQADIVVGANNGIHLLRNMGPLGRSAWPMFHANKERTGWNLKTD